MTRAISRNSFNELKQYLSVHLQQGRVILDSDWNEAQDIMAMLARRLGQDAFGDGIVGGGFEILPVIPTPWGATNLTTGGLFEFSYLQGHLPTSVRFPPPGATSDSFEALDGWALSGTGKMRLSRDRPYEGSSFLRVSDTSGTATLTKTLQAPLNLSALQYAHYRFRVNAGSFPANEAVSFFIQDAAGHRNSWTLGAPQVARERWAIGAAQPLDLRFQLFDIDLLPAIRNTPYTTLIPALGTTASPTWSATGLPAGLSCTTTTAGSTPLYGRITGTPTTTGTFTVSVTANAGGPTATRDYTLRVMDALPYSRLMDFTNTPSSVMSAWNKLKPRGTVSGGGPVDLSNVIGYGFVFTPQASGTVWDFDALYFSSRNLVHTQATNNFVIAGPSSKIFVDHFMARMQVEGGTSTLLPTADDYEQLFTDTPRAYVGGLPCALGRDTLYTSQSDPADPGVTAPTVVRKDLVYLDVWSEPVTYVEDPELREIALGGPDTSTRMRLRQRIRIAQGGPLEGGVPPAPPLPTGNGIGGGRLVTEGTYSGRSNRLYLVEVDKAGDLGVATVRWSDDNASTIQRVIETIGPSSTKVKVEDASVYQAGDFILIRTDGKEEEHRIQSVLGNTITLQEATGASVTFGLADRPKVQRWNAFHAPIVVDPNDSTISAQVSLSLDVKIRFGGAGLKKGDFWTFRTRFLAGDGAAGTVDTARIETITFQPPQGVVHSYTPLAHLIRDPSLPYTERILLLRDMRRTGGPVTHTRTSFDDGRVNAGTKTRGFHAVVGPVAPDATFVCVWSGTVTADLNGPRSLLFGIDLYSSSFEVVPASETGIIVPSIVETSFTCDTTTGKRTAVLAFNNFLSDIVALRPTLQVVGGAGFVDMSFVKVDVFEVRGNIRRLAASSFII